MNEIRVAADIGYKEGFKAGAASRDAEVAELVAALENCRLLAARHRKEEWAGHVLRLCESAGVAATAVRSPK